MSMLSRLWPWSQIEWWKSELGGLSSQLEAATITEHGLRAQLSAISTQAVAHQRKVIELMATNSQLTMENMQLTKKLDDAEQEIGDLKAFIAGTTPKTVLHPPEIQAVSDALEQLIDPKNQPPTEPTAAWPFPTSRKP